MSSKPPSSATLDGTYAQSSPIIQDDSSPSTSSVISRGDYLQQPKLRPGITRHYASLQEHADQLRNDSKSPGESGLALRREKRRESFSWDMRSPYENQPVGTGNPLPPEQPCTGTPPSVEELIRKHTNEGSASSSHPSLARNDTIGSGASNTSMGTSSTADTLSHGNTRRSSIAGFLVRHVPDMRMFSSDSPTGHKSEPKREEPQDERLGEGPLMSSKKKRKLSFVSPPELRFKDTHEETKKATPVVEEPPIKSPDEPPIAQKSTQRGLKDRRKVKMELTLPLEMPNLPTRDRPPISHLSSITSFLPRTPRTPWIRNERPRWHQGIGPKAVTVMEEDSKEQDYAIAGNTHGSGLLPGDITLGSSQSPVFERSPTKARDRCYISRPRFGGSRSRHSGTSRSGTSESTLTRTSDGNWTSEDAQALKEHQMRTKEDLRQLGQSSKASRGRRQGWAGRWTSTGSDSPAQTPDAVPDRRFSINLFRRSGGLSDQIDKGRKQQSFYNLPWRRKNSIPSSNPPNTLAHMPLPPDFVPPGLSPVPTPPMFDVNSDVKGKLANFFFDMHGALGRKRVVKNPGRVWDSDALLMSLQTDFDVDEDEEEGPKGRVNNPSPPIDFEPNHVTPGLMTGPDGHLTSKGANLRYRMSSLGHQGPWLRMQRGEALDEQTLTAFALQESDERRKFEWLVPEHLPNSPLCPLHEKYRGPSFGICYWHGRGSNGRKKSEEQKRERDVKRNAEQSVQRYTARPIAMKEKSKGLYDPPQQYMRKRRLMSFSSP